MTSILKENTMCFALPLHGSYRPPAGAVSNGKGGTVQLEGYSACAREDVTVVANLKAATVVFATERESPEPSGRRGQLRRLYRARCGFGRGARIFQARGRPSVAAVPFRVVHWATHSRRRP